MHPSPFAAQKPDHSAVIAAETDEVISYRALDEASNREAYLFRSAGAGARAPTARNSPGSRP